MPQFRATTASICNAALRHLAIGKPIANLTEASANAEACAAFYDQVRDEVLADWNWPFATRYATLVLVGGSATVPVTPDWQYSYRTPTDCLTPRRLLTGTRQDIPITRIPFANGGDATGGLIYTDCPVIASTSTTPQLPFLEYTGVVTAEAMFAPSFAQALSFKLAFYIAPGLTPGDPSKLGQRAAQLYQATLAQAQSNAMNEQQKDPIAESEFIRARG